MQSSDTMQDDTQYIQQMLDGKHPIPDGWYNINVDVGIDIPSNSKADLRKCVFIALPTATPSYAMFRVTHKHDVVIVGGTIIGDAQQHANKHPGDGVGLRITASHNVQVQGLSISRCWGAGLLISKDSTQVQLQEVSSSHNHGDGIKVSGCYGLTLHGCTCDSNEGHGINLFPGPGEDVVNTAISSCNCRCNKGCGVASGPRNLESLYSGVANLTISKCVLGQNTLDGLMLNNVHRTLVENNPCLSFNKGSGISANHSTEVTVRNSTAMNNKVYGASYVHTCGKQKNTVVKDNTHNINTFCSSITE